MANNAHPSWQKSSLLLTRVREDADRFVASLDPVALAHTAVIHSPLLRMEPVGQAPDLDGITGVIFTSAKGVACAPDGAGRPVFCVGQQTARAAEQRGWAVRQMAQTARDLLDTIDATGPLVHLAGRHQRGDIARTLRDRGLSCTRQVIYDQVLQPLSDEAQAVLCGDKPVIVPLFSPRTAGHFARQAADVSLAHVLAISDAAARSMAGSTPATLEIAAAPTGVEMRRGVEKLLQRTSLP